MVKEFLKRSIRNAFDEIVKLPNTSGVYYFYENDRLLYVGKAKNLKSRVRDHRKCNNWIREAQYYSKLLQLDLSAESRKLLDKQIGEFRFKTMTGINPVVMDEIFHKVTRIDFEEVPHELTATREEELIYKLKPPYNHQTESDEYYTLRDGE